jgi:hypothetical protein
MPESPPVISAAMPASLPLPQSGARIPVSAACRPPAPACPGAGPAAACRVGACRWSAGPCLPGNAGAFALRSLWSWRCWISLLAGRAAVGAVFRIVHGGVPPLYKHSIGAGSPA